MAKTKKLSSRSKKAIVALVMAAALVGTYFIGLNVGNGNFSMGNGLNSSLPNTLNYTTVNQEYQTLKNNYDGKLTVSELLNGIKHGLASAPNDPYTEYFT